MPPRDRSLAGELGRLEAASLLRKLHRQETIDSTHAVIGGSKALLFSGNDYLGLSAHPDVVAAGCLAMREHGASATASRLISGNHPLYHQFEQDLAAFKEKAAALVFPSGYMANLGCMAALAGRDDIVFMDKLCHASLYDGQRLGGSRLRRYRHNDTAHLRTLLKSEAAAGNGGRRLIVTDGVFSMDGDLAPLAALRALADEFGCLLLVDDAHGTGVLGPSGRGSAALIGIEPDLEVGTMSKAMGSLGGFVTGSRETIEYLVNKARPFIFTTGLPPAVVAAAGAALGLFESEDWRRQRVLAASARVRTDLAASGFEIPPATAFTLEDEAGGGGREETCTPIIPLIVGAETAALELSGLCLERGIFIPAVRTPAVPKNRARLRMTLSAAHSDEEIARAIDVLTTSAGELEII